MQKFSSRYAAWSFLMSIFILQHGYCTAMSCDQFNLKGYLYYYHYNYIVQFYLFFINIIQVLIMTLLMSRLNVYTMDMSLLVGIISQIK